MHFHMTGFIITIKKQIVESKLRTYHILHIIIVGIIHYSNGCCNIQEYISI
jgi:hypothetical protein